VDSPMLVLAPVFATTVDVVVHLLLSHLLPRGQQRKAIVLSFAAGLIALIWLTMRSMPQEVVMGDKTALFILNLAAYWGFAFGYFAVVNLNIASLRIRILKELLASPKHSIDLRGLFSRYGAAEVLHLRLIRLTEGKQLVLVDGRYHTGKPVFLAIARVMDLLKWLILGPAGVRRFTSKSSSQEHPQKTVM